MSGFYPFIFSNYSFTDIRQCSEYGSTSLDVFVSLSLSEFLSERKLISENAHERADEELVQKYYDICYCQSELSLF